MTGKALVIRQGHVEFTWYQYKQYSTMFGATKIRWLFGLGVASVQGRFCQKVLRIHRNAAKDVCCVSAYQRDWENSAPPVTI